jgi:predicted small lipoprotein YifL
MLKTKQILVRTLWLATGVLGLIACGQPGALYLPTEPAAAQRATLPQTLTPANPFEAATPAAAQPLSPAAPTPSSKPIAP